MKLKIVLLPAILLIAVSCKKHKVKELKPEFKETYANIVHATYEDAYLEAVELKTAVYAFVASPSATTHETAKQAWLNAREPYGQTEAFRFASGPIDAADGPEGLLNAWPLDEAYIDYVDGNPASGIVNNLAIPIDAATLESMNEEGGEKNISIGYHAIEFLLWGQDDSNTATGTAGDRPYTDFVTGGGGTALNQDRRGAYLKACADLLVDHLDLMVNTWRTGGAYRTEFMAMDDDQCVTNILTGMGVLGKSELAGERMYTALDNQDQEDEHSCFSDNTHRDIYLNFKGIYNIYLGSYTRVNGSIVSGTSFSDILEVKDKKLNEALASAFSTAETSIKAIGIPFDKALTQETTGSSGPISTAVNNLRTLGDKIAEAGSELDLTIDTNLPE
jgi:putative iron-regulated protein